MNKIVILYNLNRKKHEYEAEFDSKLTVDSLKAALKEKNDVITLEANKDFSWIEQLNIIKPDLIFNICEGFYGPARESVYAAILEQLGYNYSGPDSTNLLICHNKFLSKQLLKNDILTPTAYVVKKESDIEKIEKNIEFPVIIKLNSEGSSIGLNKKSVINNIKELRQQVNFMLDKYNRILLVEKYIDGNDISIAYVEGIGAIGPCKINCDSKFYDYEMKTTKDNTVEIDILNGNFNELKNITMKIVKKLDIHGYAKLDFRVKENKFYLIEVNAQVSFHPKGEFITCAKNSGYDFKQVVNFIADYAIKQKNKSNSVGIGEI